MILVIQFRAFTPALLILAAAPLSLGGALCCCSVTGTDLNVSSAMGLILLVGLVVKNGIVMLDFAEKLRASGESAADAIAHAGRVRLRPILMTTLCTSLGCCRSPSASAPGPSCRSRSPWRSSAACSCRRP